MEDKEDKDEPCEDIEELCKESLVHVSGHLVEDQPVAQRAVLHVVPNLLETNTNTKWKEYKE